MPAMTLAIFICVLTLELSPSRECQLVHVDEGAFPWLCQLPRRRDQAETPVVGHGVSARDADPAVRTATHLGIRKVRAFPLPRLAPSARRRGRGRANQAHSARRRSCRRRYVGAAAEPWCSSGCREDGRIEAVCGRTSFATQLPTSQSVVAVTMTHTTNGDLHARGYRPAAKVCY